MIAAPVLIGTAGWSIPTAVGAAFPGEGPHLARYARSLPVSEINSSFHRPHRRSTYTRWADSVPAGFRFAVKLPKTISHQHRLVGADALLDTFLDDAGGLGDTLAVLLVQLPPSFAFDAEVAQAFFSHLSRQSAALLACEPRHASWFTDAADTLMAELKVARVAADPVLAPGGEQPGGWGGLRYHRLHGAPRIYHSAYAEAALHSLAAIAAASAAAGTPTWCIFDNTASGAAAADALALQAMLDPTVKGASLNGADHRIGNAPPPVG